MAKRRLDADHEGLVAALCRQLTKKQGFSCAIDFVMPPGYEKAHASYDPDSSTIHLNPALLAGSRVDCAYYFLHELRHAWQYQKPQDFPPEVKRSLSYVILYNGSCYKRTDGDWQSCTLEGDEAYFTDIYLAQPHELDAGAFAYRKLKALVDNPQQTALLALHRFWQPTYKLIKKAEMPMELEKVYRRIDEALR